MEDIESDTVANNLADLIVHFEKDENWGRNQINDGEEIFYSDDEEEILPDDDEENEEILDEMERNFDLIRKIRSESRVVVERLSLLSNRCIHTIDKAILQLFGFLNDAEKISSENDKVADLKKETVSILSNQRTS